jgi:hypothetical protein
LLLFYSGFRFAATGLSQTIPDLGKIGTFYRDVTVVWQLEAIESKRV